jgi:hypothetical protein
MTKVVEYTREFKSRYAGSCPFTGEEIRVGDTVRLYVLADGRKIPVLPKVHEVLRPTRPSEDAPHYKLAARIEQPSALKVLEWLRESEGHKARLFWRDGLEMLCSFHGGKIYVNKAERGLTLAAWEVRLVDPARGGLWAWTKLGGPAATAQETAQEPVQEQPHVS